jgi:hypothetical protein
VGGVKKYAFKRTIAERSRREMSSAEEDDFTEDELEESEKRMKYSYTVPDTVVPHVKRMIKTEDDFEALRWYFGANARIVRVDLEHEAQGIPEAQPGQYDAAREIGDFYQRASQCRDFTFDPTSRQWSPVFDE